ncbi:hypothetical protein [Nitrososphaera sp.]|uniref:hypothetical protein n=1 Tax=Nitrososphaera sp. TaxID=1971748 RepID=UPI00307D056A
MVEGKGLYPVTMLRLSAGELAAFSRIRFMMASSRPAGRRQTLTSCRCRPGCLPAARLLRPREQARQVLPS